MRLLQRRVSPLFDLPRDTDHDAKQDAGIDQRASFLVPLHILCCISAYPNLLVLYKILLSRQISNCSAERSMSRLKLIY